jgi:ankyrin repeat protein
MIKQTWLHPTYSKLTMLVIIIIFSVLTVNIFSVVKTVATTDSFYKDIEHPTILMKILEDNHRKTAKTLVLLGTDVNARDKCGWTALMRVAIRQGTNPKEDVQDAEMLIKAGADVNVIAKTLDNLSEIPGCESLDADSDDYNESARLGRCVTLQQACYSLGKSALSLAAYSNKAELVKTFIKAGAKVDSKDENGKTALMVAIEIGAYDSVKVLLQEGAKVDTKDENGETTLMFGIETGDYNLVNLLLQAGVDVNARNIYGQTVLMEATKKSFEGEIVKILIKVGAKVDANESSEETSLKLLTQAGNYEIINIPVSVKKGINTKALVCNR